MQKIAHDVIGLQAAIQKEAGFGDFVSGAWNGAKNYFGNRAKDVQQGVSRIAQGAQNVIGGSSDRVAGNAGMVGAVPGAAIDAAKGLWRGGAAEDKAKGLEAAPEFTPTDLSDLQGTLGSAYGQTQQPAPQQQAQPEPQQPAAQPAQASQQPAPQQPAQPTPQQQPAAPQFDPSKITRQQMQQYSRQTGARNMNSEMDRWKTWQAMQGNRNASNADYRAWKQQQAQPVKSANFNSVLTRWLGMA